MRKRAPANLTSCSMASATYREHAMGCDIHIFTERYDETLEKWVTFDFFQYNPYYSPENNDDGEEKEYVVCEIDDDRWYAKFGVLSTGVRCEMPYSFEPRGFPSDCCDFIESEYKSWEGDAHSTNYITLKEFQDMFIKYRLASKEENPLKHMHEHLRNHVRKQLRWEHIIEKQDPNLIRLVYWFDN